MERMEQSGYRNRRDSDHIYDRLYNNHYSSSMMDHQPTEPYCSPQPARINSDVVEITGVQGGVGFVAVGRLPKSVSHNQVSYEDMQCNNENNLTYPQAVGNENFKSKHRSKSENRKNKDLAISPIRSTRSASEVQSANKSRDDLVKPTTLTHLSDHASHSRHYSDPSMYSTEGRGVLTRYPNTHDLTMNTDEPNVLLESETTDKVKSRKPRSTDQNNGKTSSKDHTKHRNKRSRRVQEQQAQILPTPDVNQANTASSVEASHLEPDKAQTLIQNSNTASPLCKHCGQRHRVAENHEYDYIEEIDDDLQCDICLQPFVDPYDTKCGHTFCSICLKNYVRLKKMCPIDRKELTVGSGDCWQSSLVLRKLVNKLTVRCPNHDHCDLKLPRTDLEAHLKERCPGGMIRCSKAIYGCSYKGPRVEQVDHIKHCKFQQFEGNPLESIYPDCTKHSVELFRPEGVAELGLAIVGGNDTPLRNIIVQNIIPGSLVTEDGRILTGDIIIEVNGEDLHNVSHVEARAILSRTAHLMRFTVLRENSVTCGEVHESNQVAYQEEKIIVSLLKPPSEQLGIKITTCEDGRPGVYILELVEGRVAHANGKLQAGDRILEISQTDLRNGTPESAARIIQSSGERVNIIASRQVVRQSDIIVNPWATDKTLPRSQSNQQVVATPEQTKPVLSLPIPELQPLCASYREKVISVTKAPQESLGIVVAGGTSGLRGDLPVFVQDVQPQGVLGRDKKLSRGDLLMQVNGIQLTGLSHSQAISVLKDAAQHCKEVELVAIELNYNGKAEDFALWEELSGVHHQHGRRNSGGVNCWASWTPSWRMWLAVPPQCRLERDVVLRRQQQGLGFSIVGGRINSQADRTPVFVKYVVPNGAAAHQGNVKCGDQIVAINGREAANLTHTAVVQMLKTTPGNLHLTIMSWPGSLH
uniref:Multiple PDZ domain protein n=1 Tax=Phallusia mammillata TaxID=59560 RepID=A0A6F9DKF0_9ASCI|nr:multiple PDZ domain protein [Phallusia mammillata]